MLNRLDAAVVILLLFLLGFGLDALVFVNIPDKNQTLLAAIFGGVIGAGVTSYINWRWGASKSSGDKDAAIATLSDKVSGP